MRRTFLDPDHQAAFERRGYVVAPLLPAGDVAEIRARLERMRLAAAGEPAAGAANHSSYVAPDRAYRKDVHDFLCRKAAPRLEPILDYCLPLIASFLCKAPGAGPMDLHCDWTWTADPEDVTVNVWCPLVDVDETNGALHLVAGSQRLVRHVAAPNAPAYYAAYVGAATARAEPIPLRAGEAVIFDSTMLHWSSANRSAEPRPAVSLSCLPGEAKPAFHRADRASPTPRFELFDMSGNAYFDHVMADFVAGSLRRPSLGFVANRNRPLPRAEFERRLARRGFAGPGEPAGLFGRARALLARVA